MRYIMITLLSLFLTACVTQDQADVKMAKGCVAGINALLDKNGKSILEVKSENYSDEQVDGGLHRRITIEAVEKDGWLELDKEYSCLFMQQWGPFKMSHQSLLVQIKIDDEIFGKDNGIIHGDLEDFMKLNNIAQEAMK